MNRCPANLSTKQVLDAFLDRFRVVPQHCPSALHLGCTHLASFFVYLPLCPSSPTERRYPFKSEAEANNFSRIKLEHAFDRISKYEESERQRLAEAMLREDGDEIRVHVGYDALTMQYLPVLVPALRRHMNPEPEAKPEPLLPKDAFGAKPTVNVARWAAKLEQSIKPIPQNS